MRLPLFSRQSQVAPPPKLSGKEAAGQFLSNSGKLLRQQGQIMLQDHSTLRRNSLIISTLILVLSRIGIANASALRANGTPNETHRKKEAIKTTIRELGGWTLGYIVFRAIENTVKTYLEKVLNYRTNRRSSTMALFRSLKGEVQKAVSGTAGYLDDLKVQLPDEFKLLERAARKGQPYTDKLLSEEAAVKALKAWKLGPFVDRILTRLMGPDATAISKLSKLHTWLPLAVGGVPAVLLSGYLLEWFTQNHAQQVIDAIAHSRGGPPPAAPAAPVYVPANTAAFDAYLQQIQLKRSERGMS